MTTSNLATPCGLYCGSCRYFMNDECRGCGSEDRSKCKIYKCARRKGLLFCTECDDFPCEKLSNSIGLHPEWLEDQARFPARKMAD